MPTLATTQEFIDNLFIESDKDEYSADLLHYIRNDIFGIKLISNFNSIDEFQDAMIENPLWELFIDKFDNFIFNSNFENEIYNDSFYQNLDENNLFLLSLDEIECDKLQKQRGYIYISTNNISKVWKPIRQIRSNNSFKVTCNNLIPQSLRFDNWDKIDDYLLPLNSIVIFDKYILKDKTNQRAHNNLFKLLTKLCRNTLIKPLNLSIISEFENDKELIDAYTKIEKFFNDNSLTNISFNVIKHDKSKYPREFEGLHYRLILTNNFRLKCDDSFNFFKDNGKVNNDADLHFYFNLSKCNYLFYSKEISDLKRYLSKIDNIPQNINLPNKLFFHPSKDNYLFN